MSTTNYIAELLDLKAPNFIFIKVTEEQIKDCMCKVIYATLQNKPDVCPHCGKSHLNIHGYKLCTIKIRIVERLLWQKQNLLIKTVIFLSL